ncbi:MAG: TIR domain-containing protein [Anaerolineales bacterium]|nr:TIR domain-containing protein [Anaerolineales bacterium]
MKALSKAPRIKYRVYLSLTFESFKELRQNLVNILVRSGLFYSTLDLSSPSPESLENKLTDEMNNSDIVILLCKHSSEQLTPQGVPATQFEFEYAQKAGKPILAYFIDEEITSLTRPSSLEFKNEVSKILKYDYISNDYATITTHILGDILNLLASEENLDHWVRSDITGVEVDSVLEQKQKMDRNQLIIGSYIQRYERRLTGKDFNQLIGPLIDFGFRPNFTGQAYRFAVGHLPDTEILREGLSYEYFIDRFLIYENGIIYDRKLDLSWYLIRNQNFTWHAAIEWQKYLTSDAQSIVHSRTQSDRVGGKLASWRLPRIDELMTLLTDARNNETYIDPNVFPGEVHWLWSSTLTKSGEHAFYLEARLGQVLSDSISEVDPHRKGVILCHEGKAENVGRMRQLVAPPLHEDENAKQLKSANQSKRVFGVYLSALPNTYFTASQLAKTRQELSNVGYYISTYVDFGARRETDINVIRKEMEKVDYYLLIMDGSMRNRENILHTMNEIQSARSLAIPISVLHNLPPEELKGICEQLQLPLKEIGVPGLLRGQEYVVSDLVKALNNQQKSNPAPGWLKKNHFDTINRNIESINSAIHRFESCEEHLRTFMDHFDDNDLRTIFEGQGIITEKPEFGEHIQFVSKENPINRLSSNSKDLPILFAKIPNRFKLILRQDEDSVVEDRYLNLRWWTAARKNVSYDKALIFAQEVSDKEKELWRIPTINELATLATPTRGERKYMDEKVFPIGRWFWSSTCQGNEAFYIDFSNLRGAIGMDGILDNPLRRKSALLVSNVTVQEHSTNNSIKNQSTDVNIASGGNAAADLKTDGPVQSKVQIFLSYAHEDEKMVKDLYYQLSNAGFRPWMDKFDLIPGEDWRISIKKAIQDSDFVVACLSNASVKKRSYLQKEYKYALDIWQEKLVSDIYLIPARLDHCDLPDNLADFQSANLFEETGFAYLLRAIKTGIERRNS